MFSKYFGDEVDDFAAQFDLPPEGRARLKTLVEAASTISLPSESISDEPTELPVWENPALTEALGGRYTVLGLLGRGGMGEVWRVADRRLNRAMALKIIRGGTSPEILARFVEEAQVTAQLQHPGIVPVHDIGQLSDGRWYFTMQEVRGRTLQDVLQEVHAACAGGAWRPTRSGWTFRRLVDAFRRVCEAVAYAHSRGVIHRDLKPQNIMVGEHGEVLVVDWGLARIRGRPDNPGRVDDLIVTERSVGANLTQTGQVIGTPAYMPPEQARGDIAQIDARSDVYALGAILYEVLSDSPPFVASSIQGLLHKVLDETPAAPSAPAPLPEELIAVCQRAMSRAPEERYPDARDMAAAVGDWLEGVRKREQALIVVERALALAPREARQRSRARGLRSEAGGELAAIPSWAPEADKRPSWDKEDEAERQERAADQLELERVEGLRAAFTHSPELPEAHDALAEHYLSLHREAEAARNLRRVAACEARLRRHNRGRFSEYLAGRGALTLVTEPAGAEVLLYRYQRVGRRLEVAFERSLGVTPLVEAPLPMGSYQLTLRAPGRVDVVYPVHIGREQHWDGVAPGASQPTPIHLPLRGAVAPKDCYVPAGWFISGGDPDAYRSLPRRRLWCDGLVVRRFPVTNTEFIAFLDDLVTQDLADEALRFVPRERGGVAGELGAMIYGRDASGRFMLQADSDGDIWEPDYPVCMVDWYAAQAYAAWFAEKTGLAWRLPHELEWEKAARGVDGRFFPWGDGFDPSFCCMRDSEEGRQLPSVVGRFPLDESPYGVRGMGGNMRDWCIDLFDEAGPSCTGDRVSPPPEPTSTAPDARRVDRGGSWLGTARLARAADREANDPGLRDAVLGFRLVRALE